MKISEQHFIWLRCDAALEDAQDLILFFKPFCKHFFMGYHSHGSNGKGPHFHLYVTFLNISQNNLRAKFKDKFEGKIYIEEKYSKNDMKVNKIKSPAYIISGIIRCKPDVCWETLIWENDPELDMIKILDEVDKIEKIKLNKNSKDKEKYSSKKNVDNWLKKIKDHCPDIETEALKIEGYNSRKIVFKRIFSYIMLDKVKNGEYINRNSLNELVYNLLLRLSPFTQIKAIADEASEAVYERYFGEGPGTIASSQGQGISIEDFENSQK